MSYQRPSAKTISDELFDVVNCIDPSKRVDELTLRRIRLRANTLMKADPSHAHAILGILDGLTRNFAESKRHHRLSIDLAGNSDDQAIAYMNAGITLKKSLHLDDAASLLDEAVGYHPGHIVLAELAFSINLERGALGKAGQYLEMLKKYGSEKADANQKMLSEFCTFLEDFEIDEQELVRFVRRAAMVCWEHDYLCEVSRIWTGSDEGERKDFLGFQLKACCSYSDTANLTEEFANSVVEATGFGNVPNRVAISFVPA